MKSKKYKKKFREYIPMSFGRESVFWKWMLSYIIIILVFVVCCGGIYVYGRSALLRKQAAEIQKTAVQMMDNLAELITTMDLSGDYILLDDETAFLSGNSGESGSKTYARYLLYEKLGKYKKINGKYEDIVVYFQQEDYIVSVSGVASSEIYHQVFSNDLGDISLSDWDALLNGHYSSFHVFQSGDKVFFVKTLQEEGRKRSMVNVMFIYSLFDFEQLLYSSHDSETLFLLEELNGTGENQAFIENSAFLELTMEDRESLKTAAVWREQKQTLQDEESQVHLYYYENTQYCLTICSFDESALTEISSYQRNTVFMIVCFLICNTLVMFYFLRYNYRLVSTLLKALHIGEKSDRSGNEFALIGDAVRQMQSSLQTTEKKLKEQNNMFRSEYLIDLLRGNERDEAVEELYDIRWKSDHFAVIMIYIEDVPEDSQKLLSQWGGGNWDIPLIRFIFGNVCGELFEEKGCVVYDLLIEDCITLIVNFPAPEENIMEGSELIKMQRFLIAEVMGQCREFMGRNLKMQYLEAFSEVCERKALLPKAYREAVYGIEIKRLHRTDDRLCADMAHYIRENLSDSQLSAGTVAEYFSLSSVDASAIFKKVTGQKMASYITDLRIEEAKKLIMTDSGTLEEISREVGFGSLRTFLRCFKQKEGMTPTQWKAMKNEE